MIGKKDRYNFALTCSLNCMSYFTFQAASIKMPSLFDSKSPGGILILILYFLSLKQHLNSIENVYFYQRNDKR